MRALLIAILLGASCGESATPPEPAAVPVEVAESPADPASPREILPDAPPTSVAIPLPPSFDLEITEPGEYELRATGSPMDPALFLYQGPELVDEDDDGGDGRNARLIRFLTPGRYSVRVLERDARAVTAQLQVRRLEPLEPVAELTLGERATVVFEDLPLLQRPRNDRDASRALSLQITDAGTYRCVAEAGANRDPRIMLLFEGTVIAEDDDSGPGNDAQVIESLEPGSYVVRIRDYRRLVNMEVTVLCDAAE